MSETQRTTLNLLTYSRTSLENCRYDTSSHYVDIVSGDAFTDQILNGITSIQIQLKMFVNENNRVSLES